MDNYEQKYNEALERARSMYDSKDDAELAAFIFPELRESEDERIIEEIKFAVMQMPSERQDTKQRCLAWLEKQKEQKPADEQFPPLEGLDAIKAKYYDDGFKNGFDEGVESVKPAEWSEEDEKRIKQLIYDTEAIRAGYEKKKEQLGDRFNDALIKDCDEQINWLKLLSLNRKKMNEDVAKLCSNE